jgi:hypothetical protein
MKPQRTGWRNVRVVLVCMLAPLPFLAGVHVAPHPATVGCLSEFRAVSDAYRNCAQMRG